MDAPAGLGGARVAAAGPRAGVAGDAHGDPRRRAAPGDCHRCRRPGELHRGRPGIRGRAPRSARARVAGMSAIAELAGGLVVSCQPVPGGPFDTIEGVLAFARAASSAGARALRIEGAENVAAVAEALDLPIIGLIKRDLPDSPVRITPFLEDVAALAAAGAAVIAVDATDRPRPMPVGALLNTARAAGALAMADCATLADAEAALA